VEFRPPASPSHVSIYEAKRLRLRSLPLRPPAARRSSPPALDSAICHPIVDRRSSIVDRHTASPSLRRFYSNFYTHSPPSPLSLPRGPNTFVNTRCTHSSAYYLTGEGLFLLLPPASSYPTSAVKIKRPIDVESIRIRRRDIDTGNKKCREVRQQPMCDDTCDCTKCVSPRRREALFQRGVRVNVGRGARHCGEKRAKILGNAIGSAREKLGD
jgi:hypothetical protein